MINRYPIFFLLLVFSIIFLNSCEQEVVTPEQPVSTGTIQGKVAKAIDSLAINDASVQIHVDPSSVMTNQSGEFTINNVEAGKYTVTVSKSGYLENSINIYVNAGAITKANIFLNINSTSPPAPTLSLPINGARNVTIQPTLSWNTSTGATSYALQVSLDSLFRDTNFVYNGLIDTKQQINILNHFTNYYWRVKVTDIYGTSGWSTRRYFRTISGPCPGIATVIDPRNGKLYNTTQIDSQCWLKENLDIGTMVQGTQDQTNNGIVEKYCYDNNIANCNIYGGLYQWNEAMEYSTTPGAQGICPPGWHIPNSAEFYTLLEKVKNDENSLKAVGQGTGAGASKIVSGFSALLAGYRYSNSQFFGYLANFWSSTESSTANAFNLTLFNQDSKMYFYYDNKADGFSVRCLKD